jgi:CheY-like chemotaxis protein
MTPTHPYADTSFPEQPQVLLVDDDEVNLLLTALALRDRGFKIVEAGSGERALEMLHDWTPDLIVLDALMPGLDGFDTCRALRQLPGYENVPVLMLTGLDDDASITRAYQAGAISSSRPRNGACSPGACATCCGRRARGSNSSAARASWRGRRTWRAWAASTGGTPAAAC